MTCYRRLGSAMGKRGKREPRWLTARSTIGDANYFIRFLAFEMLASVDILNRLRLAEEIVTGEHYFGWDRAGNYTKSICDDVQDALLRPDEMAAELPLSFISEQRVLWEDEIARYALPLWKSLMHTLDARAFKSSATQVVSKAVSSGRKKQPSYLEAAEQYASMFPTLDHSKGSENIIRQVGRKIRENKKVQAGVKNVDRQLLWRDLIEPDPRAAEVSMIPERPDRTKKTP